MNIITKTALSNMRSNRSRNILIGIAIALTAALLTAVPVTIFGMLELEFGAANRVYPTFHAMFRQVDLEDARAMQEDPELEEVGLREDPAYVISKDPDVSIGMVYVDAQAVKSNKLELETGRLPQEADEIVVSEGLLKSIGLTGTVGDRVTLPYQAAEKDGLGSEQEKEFEIVGMVRDSEQAQEKQVYSAMVSKAFADELIPEAQQEFRVYFRIADADKLTTDEIEAQAKEKGKEYQVLETNVVENTDYLRANYVDPALYGGLTAIMVIIVLAGVLTIYSIYYVSMLHRVQEYGKLRAIGATRKQIRKLVFREGFAVAAVAIPAGLIVGSGAGVGILYGLVQGEAYQSNLLVESMKEIFRESWFTLPKPWILALAAITALVTVYLSLLRPMQVAGRVSPVEAIRYEGSQGKKKKKKPAKLRKGFREMDTTKLMLSNLERNKKRTAITIFTLSVTGIFFMVVATVLSCMDPAAIAAQKVRGDVSVYVDSWEGDQMNPDRQLRKIQQNNPLTGELKEQMLAVDGVEAIEEADYARTKLLNVKDPETGEPMETGINGLGEAAMKDLEAYVKEGDLSDPKLLDGTGVILNRGFVSMNIGLQVGDRISFALEDGEETVRKELEIVAYVDTPGGLAGSSFVLPQETLQGMVKNDLADTWNITLYDDREGSAEEAIRAIVDGQEYLEMDTYREAYERGEMQAGYMMYAGYGLLAVFGLIGILNLINTMINSVYIRRRELGMLQAIGLSGRQTVNMLQKEGLFYTAGTLVLSLGIGSIAGYLCYLKAAEDRIMSIQTYYYPVIPAIVLVGIVLAVQILITYLVNQNFKRVSLIDRIRFSE